MASQEFKIVYGSITLGGTNYDTYKLDGPFTQTQDYIASEVSAEVVCTGSTEATFVSNAAAIEAAFRIPRQALTVTLGSTTLISWLPTTDTGFNAEPSIEKLGDVAATGRSCRYRIRVRVGRPADLSGQNGRQSSTTTVNYDPSGLRTVTITGRYTAISSTGARSTYTTNSPAFFSAVKSALSITTWEQVSAPQVATDDADKYCDFTVNFRELNYDQSQGTLDDPNIIGHTVSFTKSAPAPGDTGKDTRRLETITCEYSCNVLSTADVNDVWQDTIKPYLGAEFRRIFQPIEYGITLESPRLTYASANGLTIAGSLQITAQLTGSDLLQHEASDGYEEEGGQFFTGAWTGSLFSTYVDQGIATRLRVVRTRSRWKGDSPPQLRVPGTYGANWHLIHNSSHSTPIQIGIPGKQIAVTDTHEELIYRYAEQPRSSGGAQVTPSDPPVTNGPGTPSGDVTQPGSAPPTPPTTVGGGSSPVGDPSSSYTHTPQLAR